MDFAQKLNLTLFENNVHNIPTLASLLQSNIPFVVVGARAVNVYSDRPRNTLDIDVLTNHYKELADYVSAQWPALTSRRSEAVIQFKLDQDTVLDIMIPYDELLQTVLIDTKAVSGCEVASAESLIVMKFAAIVGEHRPIHRKIIDRGDIASILVANEIDMKKAKKLSSLLYPGSENDFVAFIYQLKKDLAQ
ncbi:MAG: DUF6036 family nucleotidyltransferase [Candidatus Cloacimonetes bacterium]|jgi:hypothetical protein|nr:DUF6036 family nucleotidyltransferase [Candidatus Cloacimonadota bacterium]